MTAKPPKTPIEDMLKRLNKTFKSINPLNLLLMYVAVMTIDIVMVLLNINPIMYTILFFMVVPSANELYNEIKEKI